MSKRRCKDLSGRAYYKLANHYSDKFLKVSEAEAKEIIRRDIENGALTEETIHGVGRKIFNDIKRWALPSPNKEEVCCKKLTILLKTGLVSFCGKYRRDLEKENWHYYESERGDIFHFRKDQMVGVLEDANENRVQISNKYEIDQ